MAQAEKTRKNTPARKNPPVRKLTPNDPPPHEELIRVPKAWFFDPLRQSMRRLVRPPTALTRRKQLTIKERIPFRVFEQLLANLEPADVKGLVRSDPGGRLVPTKVTPRLRRFEYVINKGSVLEKFFKLDAIDRQPDGPKPGRWRRGLGCCRLWLGGAKEKRGQEAMTVAMVCGNAIVQLHEPTAFRAMPRLTIRMFVMTMDTNGHIVPLRTLWTLTDSHRLSQTLWGVCTEESHGHP